MASVTLPAGLAGTLAEKPRRWLVTGSAGFIGSHLLAQLLQAGQTVVSLDNFATGHQRNLDEVRSQVGESAWQRHAFIEGDIREAAVCERACQGAEIVLHQAALGSVPRSIANPSMTHSTNATGFLNMLEAAKAAGVGRFVYAASSSTYGDHPGLPKVEEVIGRPLSPYAVTKYLNELYADVFARCYGMQTIGLRYFNVFGPRQDPNGPYAAVIPRWIAAMKAGEACTVNGDGETSRDFCYVANAVQANLLAGTASAVEAVNQVYNVAFGEATSLLALHEMIAARIKAHLPGVAIEAPVHAPFRAGDVRHSLADIGKAQKRLGYQPGYSVRSGMDDTVDWYLRKN